MLKTIYGAKIADKFMDNSLQFMMRDLGTSEEHRLLVLKCCCDLILSEPTTIVPLLKVNLLSNLLLSTL
jgi:hypothetical protein